MMKKVPVLLFFLFWPAYQIIAQPVFPEDGPLFDDTVVPRVDIHIDPDTLEWLYAYENLESNIEYRAVFIYDNGTIRDTIEPVGFRLRGNTSRFSQKKSFKVSFNRFTQGGKYYGVEKLNLNGEHNDPSVMRSKVGWDLMRFFDIPAPRSNHVEVYINGDYYGLYINVEHIDEEFVKSRFLNNDGNLYKCLWPADLNYLGSDPDLYKYDMGGRRAYDLKTNTEADDYSDIAHFIDILNNTSDEKLYCKLHEVFNVDDYIKVIVIDILLGNWDGYIYNKNNFYLYRNTASGKFEYIPYDLDNTLGIDWFNRDWASRNIYDWQQHGDNYRPLYERLMNTTAFRDQYTYYSALLQNQLGLDSLKSAIAQRRDLNFPYITTDDYYPKDYGFTPEDYLKSYDEALGDHVKYGLFPYLDDRTANTASQLESVQMIPVVKYIRHQRQSVAELRINAFVEEQSSPVNVAVKYRFGDGDFMTQPMYDDGNHHDGQAGDRTYGVLITDIPAEETIEYQIMAADNANESSLLPCTPVFIPAAGGEDVALYINEFMASNEETIADKDGNYDDWIEIYNAESEAVWLGDKYLTDNLSNPDKWRLPEIYIEPGEFLLIWTCGEPQHGSYHASFKLSADGEEIGIFTSWETVIDQCVFGPQTTDVSEGRLPDGGSSWVFFDAATPRVSNILSDLQDINDNDFSLYPNPASGSKVHLGKPSDYSVYNSRGQKVHEAINSQEFNISSFNNGIYIVVSEDGYRYKLIVNR
jgi:hypothetical protein